MAGDWGRWTIAVLPPALPAAGDKTVKRALIVLLIAVVVAEQAWLLAPLVKSWIFPPREDAAAAGRRVAESLGCFSCHGPGGSGGIKNPGGRDGVIPALSGGEMMMWASSESELRELILYGRKLADEPEERSGYAAGQGTGRAIVMPAFEPHIGAGELELLIAYLGANSGLQFPSEKPAAAGLELVHELGCFRCHGPMGTGGVANPGSLKGYVPGFWGQDYAELVADRAELRQWIANGISDRFRDNPLAGMVIERQAVKMPAYGEFLSEKEIDTLIASIEWLAAAHWRDMPVP